MKNLKFRPFALLYNLLVFGLLLTILIPFFGQNFAYCVIAFLFLGSLVPRPEMAGFMFNEVVVTLFSSDLQKNLYPNNEFYQGSRVDAGVGIDKLTVQVPQAGTRPNAIKNPQVRPIPLKVRNDSMTSYSVDLYETEPTLILDINQAMLSYDKRAAVLKDHQDVLNQRIADELQINWAPTFATNILRTSGTNNTGSLAPSATGTRKEITYDDFSKVSALMDRMNIPDDGRRRMLVYSDQMVEIKAITRFVDYIATGIPNASITGSIGRIQNFEVFKRSVPLRYDNSATPQKLPFGTAAGATDNLAILFWHPDFVRRAEGLVKVYYTPQMAGYGGDVMNAALRGNGIISRLDQAGVVALVQHT